MSTIWKNTTLGQYSDIILGGTPKTKEPTYWNGQIPWASIIDFDVPKKLYVTEKTITESGLNESNTKLLSVGDIIISARGTVGKTVVCGVPMAFNQSCYALRSKSEELDQNFLYYLINYNVKQLQKKAIGGVFDTIVIETLKSLKIRIPSLPIQKQITSILSTIDDLIENNTQRISILEEMAQRIYREWFVDFKYPGNEKDEMIQGELGMIPGGWDVRTMQDICSIQRGRSYRSIDLGKGLPFLNLKNIRRQGGFREDGLKQYSGLYNGNQIARPNDIILAVTDMTQDRAIIARPARIPSIGIEKFIYSMDLVKMEPKDNIHNFYLYGLLRYTKFGEEVKEFANGANVLHLSPKIISEYKIYLPPENLRNLYANNITPIYKTHDILLRKNEVLSETRDLLLPKLISGKIDVSEMDIDKGELE